MTSMDIMEMVVETNKIKNFGTGETAYQIMKRNRR